MSLINDMLKDLEQRKQKKKEGVSHPSSQPEPQSVDLKAPARRFNPIRALLLLLLLGGAGAIALMPMAEKVWKPITPITPRQVTVPIPPRAAQAEGVQMPVFNPAPPEKKKEISAEPEVVVVEKVAAPVSLEFVPVDPVPMEPVATTSEVVSAEKQKPSAPAVMAAKPPAPAPAPAPVQAKKKPVAVSRKKVAASGPAPSLAPKAKPPVRLNAELARLSLREQVGSLRLIADFKGKPSYKLIRSEKRNELWVDLKGTRLSAENLPAIPSPARYLKGLDVKKIAGGSRLVVRLNASFGTRSFERKPLRGYDKRLVMDIHFRESAKESRKVELAPKPTVPKKVAPLAKPVPSKERLQPSPGKVAKVGVTPTLSSKAEADYQRGLKALDQGKHQRAEKYLRRCLKEAPRHLDAREALVNLLLQSSRISEGAYELRAALSKDPEHLPFRKTYARVLMERGAVSEALAVLQKGSVPVVEKDPQFHVFVADLHRRLGNFDRAAEMYRQVLDVRPEAGVWWMGYGIALEGKGEYAEALKAYRRALDVGGLQAGLIRYLGDRIKVLDSL